jgi:hypothetical protein
MAVALDTHATVDLRPLSVRAGKQGALEVIEPVLDALLSPHRDEEQQLTLGVDDLDASGESLRPFRV